MTGSRLIDPEDIGGHYPVTITAVESDVSDPTCVPAWWSVGDPLDVLYVARSGQQVRVAAPALHCEANFSGGIDDADPQRFEAYLPIDCLDCEFTVNGVVTGEQLSGQYIFEDNGCRHVVSFDGTRQLF